MPKKWVLVSLAWVFLTLSACGWQLQGNPLIANQFGTIYISSPDTQSSIIIELKRALKANNIEIVGAASNADYQIKILDNRQSRRISALNPRARAAQYQIYQAVEYMVFNALGTPVVPRTTALAESTYNFKEIDVLASENEERLLQNTLRLEIVRQIVRRLGEISDKKKGTE